jgi:hypothetical protein
MQQSRLSAFKNPSMIRSSWRITWSWRKSCPLLYVTWMDWVWLFLLRRKEGVETKDTEEERGDDDDDDDEVGEALLNTNYKGFCFEPISLHSSTMTLSSSSSGRTRFQCS